MTVSWLLCDQNLAIFQFDQMMELEPEQTAKQLFLAVQLIYIPTTIISTVVDLQTGVK